MRIFSTLLFAICVCILAAPAVQANSLCQGKEGLWISEPVKDPNFGNYYLGGMCDNNSCYHITIATDEQGQNIVALTFTCDEIGDGTQKIQWVFVDVESGEKHEFMANLQEVNDILRETLND